MFPQDAYPDHAGPHDYTRAVLNAEPPPLERRRARPRGPGSSLALSCLAVVVALGLVAGVSAETWRGLTVAPEHRCAPYDKKRDYPYPQSVERDLVRELGAVYGPYTGICFASTKETDIEHIVAASEAHDSGLCAQDAQTRARFARDRRNLTLASPRVNRHEKSGKDAAEWVPDRNKLLVRSTGARRAPDLRAHHRPARGGGARSDSCCLREHRPRARGMRGAVCLSECARSRSRRRSRCTRAVRRQSKREDHLQGGAPAWDCSGPAFAPGLSLHARCGRGWRRVRVAASRCDHADFIRAPLAGFRPGGCPRAFGPSYFPSLCAPTLLIRQAAPCIIRFWSRRTDSPNCPYS